MDFNNNRFNGYSGFGTYPFPNYTNNFSQQYQTPYNYPQQQNQMMGQQQQAQPQPQQQNQSNGSFYYVNGIEGAKAFLLQPNASAVLFDSDSNKFFIKSANQQGQATLQEYEYTQISPKSPQKSTKDIDLSNYATKEDIKALRQELSDLVAKQPKQTKENKQNV